MQTGPLLCHQTPKYLHQQKSSASPGKHYSLDIIVRKSGVNAVVESLSYARRQWVDRIVDGQKSDIVSRFIVHGAFHLAFPLIKVGILPQRIGET